jgi:membrane protease YdiL (CAAX protease family)
VALSNAPANASSTSELSASEGPAIFAELCWLCGIVLIISVLSVIYARIWGESPLAEWVAMSAVALLTLTFVALNRSLVRAALRIPGARGVLETVLVALIAAPSLTLGFWLLGQLGFETYSGYLDVYWQSGVPIWVGFAAIALVTPVLEELLFRGLIQPKLERIVSPTEALIVQAALFSALHLSPVILITHFGMGLAFGWLRRGTGSVFPGMVLHAAWNGWVLWSSLASPARAAS